MKRFIATILTITMLSGTLTAFATENIPQIDLNNTLEKNEITVDYSKLPTIEHNEASGIQYAQDISAYNNEVDIDISDTDNRQVKDFVTQDTIELPPNKTQPDDNGWVLSNEIDEEDLLLLQNENQSSLDEENTQSGVMTTSSTTIAPFDSAYRISNINAKDALSLQNQTGRTNFIGDNIGKEYIDPMTGNLIVTETDLVLPGVDGLDLNLSRYYSLAQAELFTKSTGIEFDSNTYVLDEDAYIVIENVYNTETGVTSTYNYPYFSQDAADLRVEEIESRDTCNGLYIYNAWWETANAGETITFDYYYTSELNQTSYQRMRNDLGAGWSWSFPSVQTVKDVYWDEEEMPKALYYHDGKGNVMEVKYDNLNGCWFENYVGSDITFEIAYYYDTDICTTSRIDYIVEDSDGTEYYFGMQGEIRTIMDRYGNKITFGYTDKDFYGASDMPIITEITDSVGRTIDFDYDDDDDYSYITITVTSPIASEGNLTLTYEKKMIDVTQDGTVISTEPFLESVTNAEGEVTSYYPAWVDGERSYAQPILFTFADKTFDSVYVYNTSGYTNNLVYLLGNIVRPHSNTYYYYDLCERNLGHSGISQAYRMDERGDDLLVVDDDNEIIDGYSNNVVRFRYSRDYTGYPYYNSIESIPNNKYISRTRELHENATYIREYYKIDDTVLKKYEDITYFNPVGNDLTVNKEIESFLFKQPVMTKLTYNNGNGHTYDSYVYIENSGYQNRAFGKPLTVTEELDHDTVHHSNREKHAMLYTYDDDTGLMLTKSWYKSSGTKCTQAYTYNSKKRLSKVTLADNTETQYAYEYASNGKVSKVTETTSNGDETTVIEKTYTSATGYSLPSTVTKTVSNGDTTTTDIMTYTYNMLLGVVTSETDADGNVTRYEYDKLGRPIRIVYPKYSTYTAYGTKNAEILPVEDISYNRAFREYDTISGYESLASEQIVTTLSYYDVTDATVTYPTNEELSAYSRTYYGGQVNYYLGTGELIENNMLDTINGETDFATTTYYYDTDANTLRVVNPNGDTTTTQYDGMGRVVKIIDAFDNYHITEYNINSDEVGFKAQSYFVPASDRTAKENITEIKYDRLSRAISEKAYSSYPDSFSEVQYFYDYVGNVTGIIDANENLNNDGYTVKNTYDKRNRLTSSKNANNETLTNTYDNLGNIKTQTITANGETSTLFERNYDGEGKLVSDTDNAGNSNTYYYNNKGQLTQSSDKDNKFKYTEYNELGVPDLSTYVKPNELMTARNYNITTPYGATKVFDLRAIYDEDNAGYGVYDNHTASYSYSQTGKLLSQINEYSYNTGVSGISFMPYIRYTYDANGNVLSAMHGCIDDVNETVWAATTYYEYDRNRPVKVQIDGENTKNSSDSANARYEYYSDGKLKSIIFPTLTDGSVLKSEYTYNELSQLTTLTNYKGTDILSSYSYTYDSNGNILTTTETVNGVQNTTNYTYDKLNRIATVSGTKGADSYYEYDARGNRKANFEQIDFISEESAAFNYDELDKLYYASVGDETQSVEYSDNGLRYVKRENTDMPEYYVYDTNGRLMAEATLIYMTISGEQQVVMYPVRQYIWGAERVLAQKNAITGNSYYYLYNGHGDVIQIIDTTGTIVNSYDYDVWGNFLKKEETIENPFTYLGQTYDEVTGFYYLRTRYYDPTTGRFTQQDPAEDGYNWYVYGNQNPVIYADYTGESAIAISAGAALLYEALPYIAAGAAAIIGGSIMYYKEHTSNKRKSTENKHQEGQSRKQRDSFGGEKGDARRTPRKDKRK